MDTSLWIGNLDVTLPADDGKISDGDDSIRHLKGVIKNTFPNMIGANTINEEKLNILNNHVHPAGSLVIDISSGGSPTLSVNTDNIDLNAKPINNVADGVTDGKGVSNQDSTDVRYYQKSEIDSLLSILVSDTNNGFTNERNVRFPIGTIYQSVNNVNPATTLGIGAWSRVAQGRFFTIQGTGSQGSARTYNIGNDTVGRYTQVLTLAQIPKHTHTSGYLTAGGSGAPSSGAQAPTGGLWTSSQVLRGYPAYVTSSTTGGGGSAMENSPPAYGIYVWRRTS